MITPVILLPQQLTNIINVMADVGSTLQPDNIADALVNTVLDVASVMPVRAPDSANVSTIDLT